MTHNQVEDFNLNLAKISDKMQIAWQKIIEKQNASIDINLDPINSMQAISEFMTKISNDPEKLVKHQVQLSMRYLNLINSLMSQFMGEEGQPEEMQSIKDKRFSSQSWNDNIYFNFIKQSYLITADWWSNLIKEYEDTEEKNFQKLNFQLRQVLNAYAPTNFLATNPEVIKQTLESKGENIIKGLDNFIHDLNQGYFNIQTAKEDFVIGKNLAATKGEVILRNDMIELIHYAPTTETQYDTPLLVIPPWINKYYVFDLQTHNSFVKWLLDQGHNLFMISWVNPDQSYAHKALEDYMLDGPLAAIDLITEKLGIEKINVMGYCLGGTLLVSTLAYLAAKKKDKINTATLLTTLVDFSDTGELSLFIEDTQVDLLEARINHTGFLHGKELSSTMNMLKSNEMIWSCFVNNYLLGKDPTSFDVLYWNSDNSNLPAAMYIFYLRNMYLNNNLIKKGKITLAGEKIDISHINTPLYVLAAKEDHIVPWQTAFKALKHTKGKNQFCLTASGHVVGVMNHPAQDKYCYWTNSNINNNAETWFAESQTHQGSWWIDWQKWQNSLKMKKVPAKSSKQYKFDILEAAPGTYVKKKCE